MMVADLSPTMRAAIELAKKNGGELHRFAGGYWAGRDWRDRQPHAISVTVESLVRRGLATYTAHREGRCFTFPIRMTLNEANGNG